MHALLESVERQGILHQQLRGLKHTLVSAATRVQVAARVAEEDGASMAQLRQEALQAKMNSMEAEKKAGCAADIIQDLNKEIINLKKALREANILPENEKSAVPFSRTSRATTDIIFEEEVDELMRRYMPYGYEPGQESGMDEGGGEEAAEGGEVRDFASLPITGIQGTTGEFSPAPSPVGRSRRRPQSSYGDGDGVAFADEDKDPARTRLQSGGRGGVGAGTGTETGFGVGRPKTAENGIDLDVLYSSTGLQFARPSTTGGLMHPTAASRISQATPFQKWKTEKLEWCPDNPLASEYCDVEAAEVAAQLESLDLFSGLQRATRSRAGKIKLKVFDSDSALTAKAGAAVSFADDAGRGTRMTTRMMSSGGTGNRAVSAPAASQSHIHKKPAMTKAEEQDHFLAMSIPKKPVKPLKNVGVGVGPVSAIRWSTGKTSKEVGKGDMPVRVSPLITSKAFTGSGSTSAVV
jgi:hypothetical protein